jgi:hypothetical protein
MTVIKPFNLVLLFCCWQLASQAQSFAGMEKSRPLEIPVYVPLDKGLSILKLPTGFAESVFLDKATKAILNNSEIFHIDLAYTEYPAGNNFEALNRRRFNWLAANLPKNWGDGRPEVRLVRQTLAKNQKDADKMFHGFYIYYRKRPDAETTRKEIEYIKSVMSTPDDDDSCFSLRKAKRRHIILRRDKEPLYIFCYDSAAVAWLKKKGRLFDSLYYKEMFRKAYMTPAERNNQFGNCLVFIVTGCLPAPPLEEKKPEPMPGGEAPPESTVMNVLNRNPWKNMLVCMDVTGSMSPHSAQTLAWLRKAVNRQDLKYLVAFNDGDHKTDKTKLVGETGGIYTTGNAEEASTVVYLAMRNGTGGDIPENDVEALLTGMTNCKECEDVVLIADNLAPVRDTALITKLSKPVKVIVCGLKDNAINTDLLDIARRSGGSIHTMDQDLATVAALKEGQSFTFENYVYKVVNNRFTKMRIVPKK